MIPIGAIAAAAIIAARAMQASGKGGAGKGGPTPRAGAVESAVATAILVVLVGLPLFIGLTVLTLTGAWLAAPFAVGMGALCFPWTFTRLVLIPLGLHRAAYRLGRMATITWSADPSGGATYAAARALLQKREASPEAIDWVEARLAEAAPLRAGGALAAAALCLARGDRAGADLLAESVELLDPSPKVTPWPARKLARELRAALAAERGDWEAVLAACPPDRPRTQTGWLLEGLALRLLGRKGAPAPFGLYLRWLLAPRRAATLPFVQAALAHTPEAQLAAEPPEAPAGPDPLARAVAFHARASGQEPARLGAEGLRRLGQAWDAALDTPELKRQLAERALALEGPAPEEVLRELRRTVQRDLADLAVRGQLPVGELSGSAVLEGAARLAREGALAEVESLADALGRRAEEERPQPVRDEWREFLGVREAYDRAARVGGDEGRRLCFPKVHTDVCSQAVFLWNKRKERAVGNAMFRWLKAEAERVGDERAVELQTKNAKLGG